MSRTDQNLGALNLTEGEQILRDLRALREQIVVAWGERAVILSQGERDQLREEIHDTCELLFGLVGPGQGKKKGKPAA